MSKSKFAGWVISALGTAVWLYGYFVTGKPTLIDWPAFAPWWIADFMPNLESETGVALMIVGMVVIYWPSRQ
jgi:hypothetical protein